MPWLDASVAMSPVIAPGRFNAVDDATVVLRAAEEEAVDAAAVKKVADTVMVKKGADDAVAAGRVAMNKKAADALAVKKTTDDVAVAKRFTAEVSNWRVA
jgi:hypothetical protein